MGVSGAPLTAILGATLFQLVPWVLPHLRVRAAWCWPNDPPKCVIPTVTGGSCINATGVAVTELQPGENCTPTCDAGLNVTGSCSTLLCPPSVPGTNNLCTADQGGLWWPYCGYGPACVRGVFTLDATGYSTSTQTYTFGHYSCADPNGPDAASICGGLVDLVIPTTDGPTDAEILDSGTIGLVAALFFVALMGMLFSLCCTGSCARLWFKPGPKQWTPANVMGILAVIIAVVAACCLPNSYKSTGIAAGLGTALTLVWSFFKLGAHDVLQMTREAAWRIHAVIGMLTLVVGIVHGVFAFIQVERQVFTEWHFLLGFIGLILMIFGVLPAHLVHYDKFKLIHFMSFWGYLLCFIHMIGHAVYLQSVAAIAVAGANGLALLLFFVQKIWVKATAGKVETKSLELVDETGGQHLFLNMHVPNFSFKAGQWGHLTVPSLGSVPHPFTLVPGDGDSNVRIFMKINRSGFTAKLAKACAGGTAPPMKLEGPHGLPCVPAKGMQRTVFVFGGVGITPGLSLAKAASDISGRKVALYWSLRSLELLKRAAPLLEPHLELSQSCVQLNGSGTQEGGTDLPLQAKYDLKDLYQWLDNVGQVYVKEGVSNAMVFVCGPPGLADAAKAAAKKSAGGIHWHVHVEEFLFLPSLSLGSKRPPTAPTPVDKPMA